MEKKAQFETRLFAIILIFIIAIILFFFNHFNHQIYTEFDEYFNESDEYTDTAAHNVTRDFREVEESSIWDYAFLAIFIGFIIQIILFSFATRINIAFYWILILFDIPILAIGVMLSNVWQSLSANAEFVATIARFPITNTLLGSYFPMVCLIIFFFSSIFLFGKKPGT